MNSSVNIDFVITWVDNKDPVWLEKKKKYTDCVESEGNSEVRYRDWDTLKYWFRGVERFAPWVRNVYFITDDQKPEWLNTDHPKLKWIKHTDFIPEEYLPTFCSDVIEWNIHRIESLSENFVYFNDDMFLINNTRPEDFFRDGKPCGSPLLGILYSNDMFSYMMFNNMYVLNQHFSLKQSIRKDPWKWIKGQSLGGLLKVLLYGRKDYIPYIVSGHIHIPYAKKVIKELWEKEYQLIDATCKNKLRTRESVTLWLAHYWQFLSGDFYPQKPIGKFFHTASMSCSDGAIKYLKKQKGKVICLNDSENEVDFEIHKKMVSEALRELLPDKSSFEL